MDREPEKLNLTKEQVIAIINRRITEWKKNWRDNKEYIIEAYAVRLIISRQSEKKFGHFWKILINDIDAIRYENVREELPQEFKKITNVTSQYSLDFSRSLKNVSMSSSK